MFGWRLLERVGVLVFIPHGGDNENETGNVDLTPGHWRTASPGRATQKKRPQRRTPGPQGGRLRLVINDPPERGVRGSGHQSGCREHGQTTRVCPAQHARIFKHSELLSLGFPDPPPRGLLMIPEGDLMRLIARSNLPEAEQFERKISMTCS
jgi:hypothetical protein